MAGGGGGRSLKETPTWAVAVVCFVLVAMSIVIEHIIHLIGKWLKNKNMRASYESLEKIKSELMLLGFISLLLTVGQDLVSNICVSAKVGATWHPCSKKQEQQKYGGSKTHDQENRRKLLSSDGGVRRILAAAGTDKCAAKGKVPLVSTDGIHQLHIFIFVLAVFHVLHCIITITLGRAKMRSWKAWEDETRTAEYEFSHDPERFRFARETSFGRRHLSFWSKTPILLWIVCFFRQFVISVTKVDYLTLRHGFIMAHLAPQSQIKFDFRKYISKSLEEDFKLVVVISPPIWFLAVLFLLFNTHGLYSYLWLPFIPLIIILLVGTKLQVIITKMGLRIQEKGEVVKGVPVVEPGDDLFWFSSPRVVLYLINFVLFQNAFQLALFAWTSYQFGLKSCFHEQVEDIITKISMGVLVQILCSYVTLPLYALVTQMGSTIKMAIFSERVATALKNWQRTAKKHVKHNKNSAATTPMSSRPVTPTHDRDSMSPVHLLRYHKSYIDSLQNSPRRASYDFKQWEAEGSQLQSRFYHSGDEVSSSSHQHDREYPEPCTSKMASVQPQSQQTHQLQHEIKLSGHEDFSFDRTNVENK